MERSSVTDLTKVPDRAAWHTFLLLPRIPKAHLYPQVYELKCISCMTMVGMPEEKKGCQVTRRAALGRPAQ